MRTYALLCCSESSKFGVETASLLLLPIESSDGALRGVNTDLPNLLPSSSSSALFFLSLLQLLKIDIKMGCEEGSCLCSPKSK
jgi:hypothetical protein